MLLSLLLAASVSAAPAPSESFAVVIGNNVSPVLARRSLQYADDDAVKYFEVFKGFMPVDHVRLLTRPDADTARLFPAAAALASAPTRAAVDEALAELARATKAARGGGKHTQAYVVFAGHGDVDQGRGFLELEDGVLSGDALETALERLEADEVHVILDSCNSFFVLSPRKPGGRHFATPKDAALHLSERLPNVGLLVSTSAEAEVYEWSQFQSGIFSHAVRSALTGAADADGDGRVSYAEIAAFIDTATRSVANPNFRPQIFARGPRGDDSSALVDLDAHTGPLVDADAPDPLRLTVRDAQGVRWFDLHAEAGLRTRLRLPPSLQDAASLERTGAGGEVRRFELRGGAHASLSDLASSAEGAVPRGVADSLSALYQTPYGPAAFAEWKARTTAGGEQEPAYIGLSKTDLDRMHILLSQPASRDRAARRSGRTILMLSGGIGLVGAGIGAAQVWQSHGTADWAGPAIFGAMGLAFITTGLLATGPSEWESEALAFDEAVAQGHWQGAVARADLFIERRAQSNLAGMRAVQWMGSLVSVAAGATYLGLAFLMPSVESGMFQIAGGILLATGLATLPVWPWAAPAISPEDDLLNVWREERKLTTNGPRPTIGLVPLPGGAALTVASTF